MKEQPILEAEVVRTMALIIAPIVVIVVVGFVLFMAWSRREATRRAREIELEEVRRGRATFENQSSRDSDRR